MKEKSFNKKLIEVAIPLEAINRASAREKSIRHGHPSTLHLWWARRPLAACRAVLFAQLVDDPSSRPDDFPTEESQEAERERLFKIIEDLVIWENSSNEEVLERAREEIKKSCDGNLPPIYDPFSGGGSIPLEAQRLGLPAYGSDLNPVAVMIGKAMIEIPPKFKDLMPIHPGGAEQLHYSNTQGLAEDVTYYGEWMRQKAFERIGHLYPQVQIDSGNGGGVGTVVAWLWARTVQCPNPGCAISMPLLSSFVLSSKKGKEIYLHPRVEGRDIEFDVSSSPSSKWGEPKKGFKRGTSGIFECPRCGDVTTRDYVAEEANNGRLGAQPTAIVVQRGRDRLFVPYDSSPLPPLDVEPDRDGLEVELQPNPRDVWCRNFGLNTPADLFTDRQTIALNTFCELLSRVREQVLADGLKAGLENDHVPLREGGTGALAYAEAVSIYLAFAIDRLADAGSSIATWATGGFIRFTFARQALPMSWDYAECNPFSSSTGNFLGAVEWVSKVIANFVPTNEGFVEQQDAQTTKIPTGSVISSDPPYYDNIGYSDLSDFFYVWLRKNLSAVYPNLFGTLAVPKAEELIAAPYRHGGQSEAEDFFLGGMTDAISNLADQDESLYPATIYYAFKQSEIEREGVSSTGWATFLQAVIRAGYTVVGTWPVRTERSARTIAVGTNALATSVVLVCRKRKISAETVTRAEFIRALKQELPEALSELQKANITPVDMPQASIGPGIGVFSRYSTVLESDDSPMSVKTALQIINHELDTFLSEQEGEFDAETRFAVSWFEQNGMESGPFGDADNLARARGLSVDDVKHAGVISSSAGKVRLLARDELLDDWRPLEDVHIAVWECTQYLIRALQDEGEFAAAKLLKQMNPEMAAAARDLAYRLFDICDKQGSAKEAGSYNSLIAVWPDLTAQASSISDADLGDGQLSML